MEKKCRDCEETKPLNQFHPAPQCRMSVRPECKSCTANRQRSYGAKPEVKLRIKKYHSSAVIRQKQNAARRSPKGRESYKRRSQASPSFVLSFSLYRALKRRPAVDPVTHEELMQIFKEQNGLCALSGLKMTWMRGRITLTSLSIDRIDSAKGYTRDNVRLVCHGANRMKGDSTDEQVVLALAKAIVSNMTKSADPSWWSFPAYPEESAFMVLQ